MPLEMVGAGKDVVLRSLNGPLGSLFQLDWTEAPDYLSGKGLQLCAVSENQKITLSR